jgi:hypothetical protein
VPLHLLCARSWKQREDRFLRVDTQTVRECTALPHDWRQIEQRMSHEVRLRSRSAEQLLFEGQHNCQAINVVRELAHAAAMPGPYLGRDEIQHGDVLLLREVCESQIESRIIDRDDEVGTSCADALFCVAPEPGKKRQMLQHFHEAHHGQVTRVCLQLHTRRGHEITPQANQLGIRPARF